MTSRNQRNFLKTHYKRNFLFSLHHFDVLVCKEPEVDYLITTELAQWMYK